MTSRRVYSISRALGQCLPICYVMWHLCRRCLSGKMLGLHLLARMDWRLKNEQGLYEEDASATVLRLSDVEFVRATIPIPAYKSPPPTADHTLKYFSEEDVPVEDNTNKDRRMPQHWPQCGLWRPSEKLLVAHFLATHTQGYPCPHCPNRSDD